MANKESKDPFKKLTTQPDILGCYTIDPFGIIFRSTIEDPELNKKYGALTYSFLRKLKKFLALRKPDHDLLQYTIRLKDMEIIIHTAKDFSMVTFRKLTDTTELDEEVNPDIFADESADQPWFNIKKEADKMDLDLVNLDEDDVEEEEDVEENERNLMMDDAPSIFLKL